jgi:hypothetical protein
MARLLPVVAWLAGVAGMAALWLAVSLATRGVNGWLALLAAVDLALLLRLSGQPAGPARAWAAAAGTALAIVVAYWFVLAMVMGRALGLEPLDAASRLGPVLAGELLRHAASGWDLAWALLALPLAWRLAR